MTIHAISVETRTRSTHFGYDGRTAPPMQRQGSGGKPMLEQPTARWRIQPSWRLTIHEEVQRFLDHLALALTAGDGATVATLWETPALVLGNGRTHAVGSRDEVARFFSTAKDQYQLRGIVDTRAEVLRLDRADDRTLMVDVRWPYFDGDGREVGAETSTYVLVRDDTGALRVRVAILRSNTK